MNELSPRPRAVRTKLLLAAAAVLFFACGKPRAGEDGGHANDAGHAGSDGGAATIAPTAETLEAAQAIQLEIPGAVLSYSLHTGLVDGVQAPGLAGLGDPAKPLVESHGVDADGNHAALMEFFLRHHAAFGVTDPSTELQVPVDAANDDVSVPQEQFGNADLPAARRLRARHFAQAIGGVRIPGREVVGTFDTRGGLLAVNARLAKVDATFAVIPAFNSTDLWTALQGSLRDAVIAKNASLSWLKDVATPEHSEELVVEMVTPDGSLDSADPSAAPRLAYRVEIRYRGQQALLSVDAKSKAVLLAADTMPSDWISEGEQAIGASYDELGTNYLLYLTTNFGGTRYLAVVPTYEGSPSWVAKGQAVIVSTTAGQTNKTLIYKAPISISTDYYWYNAPSYTGTTRQASALMSSIMSTFDYWSNFRGWNGWDGQGSTFYGTTFVHKQTSSNPELNAWGGNGGIQIGDGTTATGQYLGSSHMVMGHELTHNVITATTKLTYLNESGAANESLADFFGMAVTGSRAGDDFSSDYLGSDVGWNLRNMVDPTVTFQPAVYADYKKLANDSGGVHTNSGILNKAHTLLVKGGTFQGYTIQRVGLARTEQILWASMRFKSYGTEATLEEFAKGVLNICSFIRAVNDSLGDPSYAQTCASFRNAYTAVGVIPSRFSILVTEAVRAHSDLLSVLVTNPSGQTHTGVVGHSSFKVTDLFTGTTYTLPAKTATSDSADGGSVTDLVPGDRVILSADLPEALQTVGNATRALDVSLVVDNVKESPAGELLHHAAFTQAADYQPSDFSLTASQVSQAWTLKASLTNLEGNGVSAGVSAACFGRFGGHAAFDEISNLSGIRAVATAQNGAGPFPVLDLVTGADSNYSFANGLQVVDVPDATAIPGRPGEWEVWFDDHGGLDSLNDHLQVYVLADSGDQVTERNETNNLLCVNCRAPGQILAHTQGVIVRFPKGTDTTKLFPASVQAAAAKLPAPYVRALPVSRLATVHLPYKAVVDP